MSFKITGRVDARDVELAVEVPEGKTLAVIGPNAAGKSTLLAMAAGLLTPDQGHIELGGKVLTDTAAGIQVPPHKRRVGLLAQRGLLFKHLSVLENVAFGPRSQGVSKAEAKRRALEWLERIGVAELANRRATQLSGGQAQRVALARTLAAEPAALLLDEPTSALDVKVAAQLRHALAEVTKDLTTILVSHDLLDIVSLADEVVVINQGRVVESGSAKDVLTRPTSAFAAELAGVNLVNGEIVDQDTLLVDGLGIVGIGDENCPGTGAGVAIFSPSAVTISRTRPDSSARNIWPAVITALATIPHGIRVHAQSNGFSFAADITAASASRLQLAEGDQVYLSVKAQEVAISASAS